MGQNRRCSNRTYSVCIYAQMRSGKCNLEFISANFVCPQPFDENNQSTHQIDTSAYVAPEMDEKTQNLLSMSVCIMDPEDPFDAATKEGFLRSLEKPLVHYDNYNVVDDFMPEIKKNSTLYLGEKMIHTHM